MVVKAAGADKRRRSAAVDAGERPGYALPSDLEGSLRYLSDGELDRLLRAVAGEARRRGRPLAGEPAPPAVSALEKQAASPAKGRTKTRPVPVPPGQARLIRAAHEAGVKPGAIARELRLSRAQVEHVIGAPRRGRG